VTPTLIAVLVLVNAGLLVGLGRPIAQSTALVGTGRSSYELPREL
jgi:hypothetical protein